MKLKLKLIGVFLFLLFMIQLMPQFLPVQLIIQNSVRLFTEEEKIVYLSRNGIVEEIELEKYLMGVVPSEMPVTFELEALKAQAVAARSFVVSRHYQVDDTTSSQVYKDEETLRNQWQENYEAYAAKIQEAVQSTKNEILMYDEQIVNATFFSSSNGKTNNAQDYWVSAVPYLVSVDSPWDHQTKEDNTRSASFNWSEVNALLGEVSLIEIMSYYDNGYVKEVLVNETYYSGREIREMFQLSSSAFQIVQNEEGLVFETVGSGHGVGMSQYGAFGMALEGYNYQEILKHYYQGAEIAGL